jgi:hypothetical protein
MKHVQQYQAYKEQNIPNLSVSRRNVRDKLQSYAWWFVCMLIRSHLIQYAFVIFHLMNILANKLLWYRVV